MPSFTASEVQAAGDPDNTLNVYIIQQGPLSLSATYDVFYCVGKVEPYAGRSMWARVTKIGEVISAATMDAEIKAALVAGPLDPNTINIS